MNKKKWVGILSIGAILGGFVSAGIPITAEAVINAYTVKVKDGIYKYDKQELINDFLNFKCGDKSTLYDDFARKLKEGNGFYAFHDTEKGFIDFKNISDTFLKNKEENKSFDVEEFVKSKEAKVIEVSWVKKAIVTKEGEIKYETPLNDDTNNKDNAEKEKENKDKDKDKDKTSSHHKNKHSDKSSLEQAQKEKEAIEKQEQVQKEKEAAEKQKQEQAQKEKEAKEKQKQEEAQKEKEAAEKQKQEQVQKEKEAAEKQKQEQAQKEKEAAEKQKQEQVQKEKEAVEKQKQEQAQKEKEAKEKQKQEQAQKEKEAAEKQKQEQVQKEKEAAEKQKQEQVQKEKEAAEKQKQEQAQKEKEAIEKQKQEQAQKEKEAAEKQKQEQAQKEKEAAEKQKQEQKEKEAKEKQAQKEAKELIANNKEEFHNIIKDAIIDCKPSIKVVLPNYNSNKGEYTLNDYNDLVTQLEEMDFGKPEGQMNCQYDSHGGIATITFKYKKDIKEVKRQKEAAITEAKRIVNKIIKPNMTDVEKELALHDYIVKTADYDTENYKKKTTTLEDHNAYGVLVNHIGVCESYAKAMNLLLKEVGIDCKYVTGTGNGGGHAWNIVKLDNEWYNLDTTWDDPVSDRNGTASFNKTGNETVRHTYFNVPDSIFSKDHTRGNFEYNNYPKCTATKYYYENMDIPEYTADGQLIEKVTSVDELHNKILTILQCKKTNTVLKLKNINMDLNQLKNEVNKVVTDNKINIGFSASYGLQGNYFSCEFKFK